MFLTARRLFDGRSDIVRHDWGVEVRGERISDVRPRAASDHDVVDLGDATLLPGLVDVHQHLVFDASNDPVGHLAALDDATLLLRMAEAARRALAAGITTIRDLGDRGYLSLTLRDRFRDGAELGPRIVAAGPPLTVTDGHCWFLGGEADGVNDVRRAVRERATRGVDVVKLMVTGGNLTPSFGPHESQYGLAEIRAAVEEAHVQGLRVAAHAHGSRGIADAVAAGVDSVEHCTFFTAGGVEQDPATVERIVSSGTVVSATAATLPGIEPPHEAMRRRLGAILANHAVLFRAGARMVCSSDAGVVPGKPHDVLPYGVAGFLPALGMSNAQALRTSTAVAAAVCGVGDRTGTLEPGKDADILAVAGDPLADLAALHDVVAVFARGRRVPRPSR
jgi:imidazolonepropionase-like amidohydrolase